jgi:Domain of unknown function (DUF5916)/Carbohydrate family 9 binding domain-like
MRTLLFCFNLFLFFSDAVAQSYYQPVRILTAITLDGKLLESEWQLAVPLSDFMQTDPASGAAPTEKTEVRMLYNDEHLFVGFHCYDSTPSKIVRFFMDRDFELGQDDGISVQLDTYNDKSTAVMFITNSLGARFDSEVSNNGSNSNDDYNNFWDVAIVVDSTGYKAEFIIPFSSLRFEQKEKTVMGFRFARLIKRKNELLTYPRCDSTLQNQWNNVSQSAELEFVNLKTKKPIYFTPYTIGNFEQQYTLNEAGDKYTARNTFFARKFYVKDETLDKIISNIGADLKYGITKNFTLNVTANTDFAQAEVDNRIINLSKYAVNLPEKRNFFLESQNYLSYAVGQNTQLFNSRSIGLENDVVVPIIGGVRITGKQNGYAIGALNMQTTNVKSENITAQNFSAARLRKYYGDHGSFWGGIATNRVSTDNSSVSNQSAGLDAVHHFNDKWLAGFGVATTYDSEVKRTIDKNTFLNLFAFKNVSEGYWHSLNTELVGEKFNPAMGFINESDYGNISFANGKETRFKNNRTLKGWGIWSEMQYRFKEQSGLTETKFANIGTGISWKKGSVLDVVPIAYKEDRLFGDWELDENLIVPAGYYHMTASNIELTYDQSKSITGDLFLQHGDFYGGKLFTGSPSVNYIVNRFLRFGIDYEYNQINFPAKFSETGEAVFTSNLIAVNVNVTQSSKFSIKLLAQYDDGSDSFGGNLRLRYNPREGTDLYIVYNSTINTNRLEAKPNLPIIDQQAIVVKYSVTFGL